jgi:hypothetical protein
MEVGINSARQIPTSSRAVESVAATQILLLHLIYAGKNTEVL